MPHKDRRRLTRASGVAAVLQFLQEPREQAAGSAGGVVFLSYHPVAQYSENSVNFCSTCNFCVTWPLRYLIHF